MRIDTRTATFGNDPEIEVKLRRSVQARRLNLRVSGLDGRVTLTMPRNLPLAEALAFLREKEAWLRSAMARAQLSHHIRIGSDILLRGQKLRITQAPGQRDIRQIGGDLLVPNDPKGERTGPRVAAYFKTCAQKELLLACDLYAEKLGRRFSAINLRDTRSRWGSCNIQGRLMFSWRLIMAPPEVLRYVAAHEVVHLAHMDHSPAFWACVARLMPDYKLHRQWLRENGTQLHGYCFKSRPAEEKG